MSAVETMEEKMRVLTINELWRLTGRELSELAGRVASDLAHSADGSAERANALISLRNIRYVLTRRSFTP
jgi:hypothetical protein